MATTPVFHHSAGQLPNPPNAPIENLSPLLHGYSESEFSHLVQKYERRLFRVALGIVKNEADAEDAVQESLMRAFIKIDGFRGDAALYTWLVRIVINTSLMVLRKRSRHRMISLDWNEETGESWVDNLASHESSAEAQVIQRELAVIVQKTVSGLPGEYNALLSEWLTTEKSMSELSKAFAITIPATKSRILRGKQKVAQTVKRRLRLMERSDLR